MRCSHDCSAWIGPLSIEAEFDWRSVLEWRSLVHTSLIFTIEFMNCMLDAGFVGSVFFFLCTKNLVKQYQVYQY